VRGLHREHQPVQDQNAIFNLLTRRESTYKVPSWEQEPVDIFVRAVHEVVHRKCVRDWHLFWTSKWLEHRSDNDIGIQHCDIESELVVGGEFPCGLFSQSLGCLICSSDVVVIDGILGGNLIVRLAFLRTPGVQCYTPDSNRPQSMHCELHRQLGNSLIHWMCCQL
jgi:hypothetical protein